MRGRLSQLDARITYLLFLELLTAGGKCTIKIQLQVLAKPPRFRGDIIRPIKVDILEWFVRFTIISEYDCSFKYMVSKYKVRSN